MQAISEWTVVVLVCGVLALSANCAAQAVVNPGTKTQKGTTGTVAPSPGAEPAPVVENYTIGVEDELQISVWREPELSSTVAVRPDGMITLPLLNDVHVVGLTTKQLQNQLMEQFKPYVSEPQVTVIPRAIKSRKVYVAGKVVRPGAYILNGNKTVLEMLLEAGGLNPFAKAGSIYVLRKTGGREQRLAFNYKKALKGEEGKGDFLLSPGDLVVVP
jgi:polysaccharide biosynthesis/export protein